jgi:hypothetical protein
METASYFLRYLPPALLSLVTVALVAGLNHLLGPLVWAGRIAEPIEVLAYSIRTSGPVVFGLAFMVFFYGIDAMKDGYAFSKTACFASLVLLAVSIAVNIAYLPKTGVAH